MFKGHCSNCPHKGDCFDKGTCLRAVYDSKYNNYTELSDVNVFSELNDPEDYEEFENYEPTDDPFDTN